MDLGKMVTLSLTVVLGAAGASAADGIFAASAPRVPIGQHEDTYGTGSLIVYTIPGPNFTGLQSTATYTTTTGLDRTITAGGAMVASPMLPNGAQIERIELRACDTSTTAEVQVSFGPCPTNGGVCTLAGGTATGIAPDLGCIDVITNVLPPLIVNNLSAPILVAFTTGPTSATAFSAVKLYYRLRVSPAPAVASFTDVPTTHGQFRFVEALAAAGITGGCGGGNFCPTPLTRGQMAVFLSSALGLHFPN